MIQKNFIKLFILLCLSFNLSCQKLPKTKSISNEVTVNFCSLTDTSQEYELKIIQTKAIVLGYHDFIFYSQQCLEEEKVIALEMDYESRQKLIEAINVNKTDYKAEFLNHNLYAEIIALGELKLNDDKQREMPEVYHPKYKFFVKKINAVNTLSEEIFPTKK